MILIPEPAASATHFTLDTAWNIQSMYQNLEACTKSPLTRLQVGGMSRNGDTRDSGLNKKTGWPSRPMPWLVDIILPQLRAER